MNKTAILRFIIDEVALKCRNVSRNMRKRIHYILTLKEITVKKYDERALILNGWIRVGKRGVYISEVEEMKKGVSNYQLRTKKQVDRMMILNNEIRCYGLYFIPATPIEVESIEHLAINKKNYEINSKRSFNRVKHLKLRKLSTDQIKLILTRCKRIDRLRIHNSSLQNLNFSQSRIKQFCFDYISFEKPIYLPREIELLIIRNCTSQNLIKAQKVNRIDFHAYRNDPKEYVELIKTLKGVKVAEISDLLKQCLTSLPPTIREIIVSWYKLDNLHRIINQLPHLIRIPKPFPIQPTDKSELRVIHPILEETEEKFNLRPRRIRIDSDNAFQLNNHPELFEKVEWVYIGSDEFNLDVLSSKIKKIQIGNEVGLKSMTLNRLEKECG